MEETIGRNVNLSVLDLSLCVLGLPYIVAGLDPQGYMLEPALANLFMGYHEKIWLEEFKTCEVVLYRRYVDDII